MIPYADLDRAIARWKTRKAGDGAREVRAADVVAVSAESDYGEVPEEVAHETSSGLIQLGDDDQLDEN